MLSARLITISAAVFAAVAAVGAFAIGGEAPAATDRAVAAAPVAAAGTTTVVRLSYGGEKRSFRLFVPDSLPPGPRPLLVGLHGLHSFAKAFQRTRRLDVTAAGLGALVVYPDGFERSWNAGTCCGTAAAEGVDDVGFLTAVLGDVASRERVDGRRVAIVGSSNGGMMAYRFGCERSDLVDVIVVMSGTNVAPTCSLTRPVSLLHVHGAADTTVPFEGIATSPIDAAGFPVVRDVVSGFAALDGCSPMYARSRYEGRSDVSSYTADGCPAGTTVRLVVSRTMPHVWATPGWHR